MIVRSGSRRVAEMKRVLPRPDVAGTIERIPKSSGRGVWGWLSEQAQHEFACRLSGLPSGPELGWKTVIRRLGNHPRHPVECADRRGAMNCRQRARECSTIPPRANRGPGVSLKKHQHALNLRDVNAQREMRERGGENCGQRGRRVKQPEHGLTPRRSNPMTKLPGEQTPLGGVR